MLQKKVSEAVIHFVRATEMVNSLGLFSSNEELAEVPTSELRLFWKDGELRNYYPLKCANKLLKNAII